MSATTGKVPTERAKMGFLRRAICRRLRSVGESRSTKATGFTARAAAQVRGPDQEACILPLSRLRWISILTCQRGVYHSAVGCFTVEDKTLGEQSYFGDFLNGKAHGRGIVRDKAGRGKEIQGLVTNDSRERISAVYEGQMHCGKRHGKGRLTCATERCGGIHTTLFGELR